MYYFLTASKDTTIYSEHQEQNTGLDQILEVSKVYYGNQRYITRALIQFDIETLTQLVNTDEVVVEDGRLIIWETESEEIPLNYSLFAYPVLESWTMGTGTRFDEISTDGASWRYSNGAIRTPWMDGGEITRGGTWTTASFGEQEFQYTTADLSMEVGGVIEQWISGNIDNYGFIIKHSQDADIDALDYGTLKFFSKETHTIYQPKLRIGWDDSVFTTGSLEPIGDERVKVVLRGFKKQYRRGKRTTIRISARPLYRVKTFDEPFPYEVNRYLPETTYYQIRDVETDTVIIPFSDYSKVSCDENGNFFTLDLSNWELNRAYKVEFRLERDGSVEYFDDDDVFEVVD